MSHDPSSADLHLIASMDEYEPDYDEWLLPNAASFHQPQWPLLFYDGTNVEIYTTNVNDKTQCINISNLVSSRTGKNEVPLENLYNRARLVVSLIRAENLDLPIASSSAGNLASPRSPSPKSKLLTGSGLERAVMGLPVAHTDGSIPSYIASLSIGKSSRKSRVSHDTTNCNFALLLSNITLNMQYFLEQIARLLSDCPVRKQSAVSGFELTIDNSGLSK